MGEGLAVMMDRLDEVFGGYARHNLSAGVGDTIRARVWITTSGFFSMPPFQAALSAFGVDRLLFSVDYPFSSNDKALAFLRGLPVSRADLARIAQDRQSTRLKSSHKC